MLSRSRAPLRLGIAFGGTDVGPYCDEFDGFVLNATIDQYAYCIIAPTQSNRVDFHALDRDECFWVSILDDLKFNGYLDLLKEVYERVVEDFKGLECPKLISFFLKVISK